MAGGFFRRFLSVAALLTFTVGQGENAMAELETFVIGSEDQPWSTWGTLQAVDDVTTPGWIQPMKTDLEMNTLNELFKQMRLFPGENPIDPLYMPGDGRMWSPNAPFGEEKDMIRIADAQEDAVAFDYFDRSGSNNGVAIYIDLGAAFPVSEIKFYPLQFGDHPDKYMKGYELFANDGRPETQDEEGRPIFHLLNAVPTNTSVIVTESFPPEYIHFVKLRCTSRQPFEIDQLEVRGEGYIREATFISEIIDLGDIANLGGLRWSAIEEPGAEVRVQTRVGKDKTTLVFHRINEFGEQEALTGETDEENRKGWEDLPVEAKGSVREDTDNWTLWSSPYDSSGQTIFAEGARQYIQITVIMESESPTPRAMVDSLAFAYSQPTVARTLLGEISPREDVDLGETVAFEYTVRPTIGAEDSGFDILQIETPVRASLIQLKVGGLIVPQGTYEVESRKELLTIRLLEAQDRITSDEDSLGITFTCSILAYGTVFSGWASASWQEEDLPQRVEERNVGSLSVKGALASLGMVLSPVEAFPNPFTPNRDGANDTVTLRFKVFQVLEPVSVSVTIYDLSGAVVGEVFSGKVITSEYEVTWDGTDDEGALVRPGVYVYRVSLDGDEMDFVRVGTVAVVY